jgi:lipoprotein-anchoring transpeptidase ErfK/SrfK
LSLSLTRRMLLAGMPLSLTACVSAGRSSIPPPPTIAPAVAAMYTALSDEPYLVPAVDISRVPPQYVRQVVAFQGPEQPGSIVVDPSRRFLYLVQENGTALRYGCGVGKAGFDYQGSAVVGRKAQWPRWTPNMIKLEPERYGPHASGVEGGLANPLGARALYLYRDGRDTLYRIHGTHEPDTIGQSVSSGCIRLFNQDIVDLHRRVPVGSSVTVLNADAEDRTVPSGLAVGV